MKLLALMKKEFLRFFRDPRLIIALLLPGVLIYAVYSVIGSTMHKDTKKDFRVLLSGESAVYELIEASITQSDDMTLTTEKTEDSEAAKSKVEAGEVTAFIEFEEGFDEKVVSYDPLSGEPAPKVKIYYRSGDEDSVAFFGRAYAVLEAYEQTISNKFDVNAGQERYDFSDTDAMAKDILGSILPFLVVILIFSSCMSVTLESVAGEKERGTLATILVTSVKRSHVALGKILPLSCIASIGATSSFLGVVLSMPKLMGISLGSVLGGFGFLSYFMLFLLIISVAPLIVSVMATVSTLSHSVKEASAYTAVVMILTMVVSIVTAFISGIGNWVVAIPLLNAVVCMQNILSGTVAVWAPFVSVALNLVYTALLVFAVAKMLSSERIMFGK